MCLFWFLYVVIHLFHVFLKSKTRLCGCKSTMEFCYRLLKESPLVPAAMGLCNVQREAVSSPDHTDTELTFSQHSHSTSNSYRHIYQKYKKSLDHIGCGSSSQLESSDEHFLWISMMRNIGNLNVYYWQHNQRSIITFSPHLQHSFQTSCKAKSLESTTQP